jgi:hypothetical protein
MTSSRASKLRHRNGLLLDGTTFSDSELCLESPTQWIVIEPLDRWDRSFEEIAGVEGYKITEIVRQGRAVNIFAQPDVCDYPNNVFIGGIHLGTHHCTS